MKWCWQGGVGPPEEEQEFAPIRHRMCWRRRDRERVSIVGMDAFVPIEASEEGSSCQTDPTTNTGLRACIRDTEKLTQSPQGHRQHSISSFNGAAVIQLTEQRV
ncbi:hypothetical protein chiPu_0014854 [Chiloscyllium punctatum]|uniref:Uncharacterized protein n=1 Tax=Chiloscyllium punctatum TaxID=137246 RepID=A0A401T152_CHIPU|nr:hypothetical protein [Chiloscyllium punctatum]